MGIKVCDLVMEYKRVWKVLNHVNLTIEHGIYGLLWGKWSRKNNTDEDIGYTSYSHLVRLK